MKIIITFELSEMKKKNFIAWLKFENCDLIFIPSRVWRQKFYYHLELFISHISTYYFIVSIWKSFTHVFFDLQWRVYATGWNIEGTQQLLLILKGIKSHLSFLHRLSCVPLSLTHFLIHSTSLCGWSFRFDADMEKAKEKR